MAKFLSRSILRKLRSLGIDSPPDAFLFRNNPCRCVFDEQMVYDLLRACHDRRIVQAHLYGQGRKLQPVYLKPDTKLGRWYLFCLCDNNPAVVRISNLTKLKLTEETFDYEDAKRIVEKLFFYSYISGAKSDPSEPFLVEVELHFGKELGLRAQFEREMLFGEITSKGQTEYYRAFLHDTNEIKPFLRSYGNYIRILPSKQHQLREELLGEWERMIRQYESIP